MPAADERIIKLRTTDCPIEQVVVYADRAEVTRRVTLDALEAGHAVLELRGISTRMDEDSVRVKGSGKATILEVGSELSYDDVDADATGTAAERTALEAELEALEKTLGESDRALSRAARERHLLEGYCAAAIAPPVVAGGGVVATSLDPAAAAKVLDFYAARAVVVDDGEALLAGKRAELDKAEAQLRARLARLRLPSRRQSRLVRVRLDVHDVAEPVALSISYMTHGARWAPSYDARADVQDGAAGALSLQLCYYGLVTNSTGEDWLDAHLALSTAQPASGGQPPALPSLLVGWQHDGAMLMMTKGAARCRAAPAPRCEIANVQCLQAMQMDVDSYAGAPPPPPPMAVAAATVSSSGAHAGASRFEIEHRATVLSDTAAHKVTVALVELRPDVQHFVAPTLEPRAFLQARTPNGSAYPLLASEKCAVYVDGTFVAKSAMPLTMPGEAFTLFLGADPAIKVEVRPAASKELAGEANLFRSSGRSRAFEQVVLLTNTRAHRPALVHVAMALPRSLDDKIKVVPLQPAAAELVLSDSGNAPDGDVAPPPGGGGGGGGGGVRVLQNRASNNLVWVVPLPAGGRHTIEFKYRVDYPADRHIQYTEQLRQPAGGPRY